MLHLVWVMFWGIGGVWRLGMYKLVDSFVYREDWTFLSTSVVESHIARIGIKTPSLNFRRIDVFIDRSNKSGYALCEGVFITFSNQEECFVEYKVWERIDE